MHKDNTRSRTQLTRAQPAGATSLSAEQSPRVSGRRTRSLTSTPISRFTIGSAIGLLGDLRKGSADREQRDNAAQHPCKHKCLHDAPMVQRPFSPFIESFYLRLDRLRRR